MKYEAEKQLTKIEKLREKVKNLTEEERKQMVNLINDGKTSREAFQIVLKNKKN